jgi:L-alanine-DL-glutamate epimerase and related enzymes of enolase superfamily
MIIERIETLHAGLGWRDASFVKVTGAGGLVGWSEYNEAGDNVGISAIVRALGEQLIGRDARQISRLVADLRARVAPALGPVTVQAIGALTNALLDLKAKSLGVPVRELFGGALRSRIPVYWSHCASYRIAHADHIRRPELRTREDAVRLGAEVRASGIRALKTNMVLSGAQGYRLFRQGSGDFADYPELRWDAEAMAATLEHLAALREGAGSDVALMLDVNFNFRFDGYREVVRALRDVPLQWLELDVLDPDALTELRREAGMPLASGEALHGPASYWPHLQLRSMDIALIDVIWNGFLDAHQIAAMADARSINVAPHNYYGPLADAISANFAAITPNLHSLEVDIDGVPWRSDLVTHQHAIEGGEFVLSVRPGWGTDVNEDAVRSHPPRHAH